MTFSLIDLVMYFAAASGFVVFTRQLLKRVRVTTNDHGIEIVKLAKPAVAAIERRGRPEFLPLTTCPGCGTPGYHLLSAPRAHKDYARPYFHEGDQEDWWPMHHYEPLRQFRHESTLRWRIRSGYSVPTRTVLVVNRECLNCRQTWLESADGAR